MNAAWVPAAADLTKFVYAEAELVDQRRFQDWYELFAEDGRYWLPLHPDQADPALAQSIVYEDKLLLRARVERLISGKAYSDRPIVRCQHILQAPMVEEANHSANRYRTRAAFLYVELRRGEQTVLAGTVAHHLRAENAALRIVEKRVDLLNAATDLPAIFLMP